MLSNGVAVICRVVISRILLTFRFRQRAVIVTKTVNVGLPASTRGLRACLAT
jgi:hypothetical protein